MADRIRITEDGIKCKDILYFCKLYVTTAALLAKGVNNYN